MPGSHGRVLGMRELSKQRVGQETVDGASEQRKKVNDLMVKREPGTVVSMDTRMR